MFRKLTSKIASITIFCCTLTAWALIFVSASPGQEMRTWADATGAFKIEASFQKVDGDNVMLKLADGNFKQIPLKLLSEADQQHVAKLIAPAPEETPAPPVATPPVTDPPPIPPVVTPSVSDPAPLDPAPVDPAIVDLGGSQTKPLVSPTEILPTDRASIPSRDLSSDDFDTPKPIVSIGKKIGDLDMNAIQPPPANGGLRSNPKYLLPVERAELVLVPREFNAAAIRLLNESQKPREAAAALQYLKSNWPKDRSPTLVKLVINCASSDEKYNRDAAMDILADREADQCLCYIFARVDDTSFTIRSKAFKLLRKIGDRRIIEPLSERFTSSESARVSSLLRSFGAAAEGATAPYLSHEDPDVRLRACNLIGNIGTAQSLPALEEMAERETTMMLKAQTRSSLKKIRKRGETE